MSTTPSLFESQLQIFSQPRSLKQMYFQLRIPNFTWIDMNSFRRRHSLQHLHFDFRSSKIYYARDDPSTKKMSTSSFLCNYLLFPGCMYHSDQSKPEKIDKLGWTTLNIFTSICFMLGTYDISSTKQPGSAQPLVKGNEV